MTAKDYLSQAWSIKIRLDAMVEQLKFLKSAAEHISPRLSDTPTQSRNIHRAEDAYVRVMEFEERMHEQYVKLNEISEAINSVSDPTAQAILVRRYLGRNTWDEIVCAVHVSRSHVIRLHIAALAEIEKTGRFGTVWDE
jgi:DNA-directed RNA polymerase specialized sigma subunit